MGVTIKDVAKRTGLSVTTVSLVLNQKGDRISHKSKQLIYKTANELNYIPNHLAVSLATKKTGNIGLIISADEKNYFSLLVKSLEEACQNRGLYLLLNTVSSKKQEEEEIERINQLIHRKFDAIIVDPTGMSDSFATKCIKLIIKAEIPCISLGVINNSYINNSVSANYRYASYHATNYLLEQNHQRIGCLITPESYSSSQIYLSGYIDALEESSIPFDTKMIYREDISIEAGYYGIKALLQKEITAVICFSDYYAHGIYEYAKESSLKIPEELSVIGLGDLSISKVLTPSLTSISLHIEKIAKKAIKYISMNNKNKSFPAEIMTPTLIKRESTKTL